MFCRHCGKDNPPDARFCEQCGEELMEGFAPAQTPPPENRAPVQDTMSGVDRWANGFDVQPGDEEEPPRKGKKNPLPLVLAIAGAVVVLGVGGYFGWNFFQSQSMTGAPAETPAPVSQTESSLPEETETPVPTETPQTSESSSQEPVEKVQVIVLKEDRSITDETGGVLAKIFFQKPVLQDGAYSAINQSIQKACEDFLGQKAAIQKQLDKNPEMGTVEAPYLYTSETTITRRERGIFSVRLDQTETTENGNVQTVWGMTFDLETGKQLRLTDLFSMEEEELTAKLSDALDEYMARNSDRSWTADGKAFMERVSLNDLAFYVEGDTVYLCIPGGELSDSNDPIVVPCALES